MPTTIRPNTFSTIVTDIQDFKPKEFETFFIWLYERLKTIKMERESFYGGGTKSLWIRYSRPILALLAAATFLLTTLATYAVSAPATGRFHGAEDWALPVAMAIYALIAAIALYDRIADLSSSYFRHLAVRIAVRNFWSNFQFTLLKEYPKLAEAIDAAGQEAARQRLQDLAKAFCDSLDALVTKEQTDFQVEFFDSLKELTDVAKQGLTESKAQIESHAAKAAESAKKAQEAAERAEATLKPGHLNVTVTGTFDGDLVVSIDSEIHTSASNKFAIQDISPGPHLVTIDGKQGARLIHRSEMIDVRSGIQPYAITLP